MKTSFGFVNKQRTLAVEITANDLDPGVEMVIHISGQERFRVVMVPATADEIGNMLVEAAVLAQKKAAAE